MCSSDLFLFNTLLGGGTRGRFGGATLIGFCCVEGVGAGGAGAKGVASLLIDG